MFTRVREWVDLAPWIRLGRVLRILASPAYVGLVFLALCLTWLINGLFPTGLLIVPESGMHVSPPMTQTSDIPFSSLFTSSPHTPSRRGTSIGHLGIWNLVAGAVLTFLLWLPVFQIISRAGAGLTAGHPLPGFRQSCRTTWSRLLKSYLLTLIPWICVLSFAAGLFLLRLPSMLLGIDLLSTVTGWLVGILAIPAGLLSFGAMFAIPLALVAMVNESDPDPFDSLSRGYEYLVRRPLSVVWYAVVSILMIYAISQFLAGIAFASSALSTWIGTLFHADIQFVLSAQHAAFFVLRSWQVTLLFALLGGSYLLLRRDAGGQDVEEWWSPAIEPKESLPELPPEAFKS